MNDNQYSSIVEENLVKPVRSRFEKIGHEIKTLSSEQENLKEKIIILNIWVKVLAGVCVLSLFLNVLLIFKIF
ncbi:MAG TPA: hypothetical protein PKJ08_13640 [Candidatus Cloacimonadota bacterium]|nr:hypothetical protein [Candidatus Cloacimonadota bacterium]